MTITLNRAGLEHAASTDAENRFLDKEGWDSLAGWHLGVDRSENAKRLLEKIDSQDSDGD